MDLIEMILPLLIFDFMTFFFHAKISILLSPKSFIYRMGSVNISINCQSHPYGKSHILRYFTVFISFYYNHYLPHTFIVANWKAKIIFRTLFYLTVLMLARVCIFFHTRSIFRSRTVQLHKTHKSAGSI